jgi:hypothetical protein
MTDFLAAEDRALLERNGLGSFDALWTLPLDPVDEPNSVFLLGLEGQGFCLKHQRRGLKEKC